MEFGWINVINLTAVMLIIIINIVAFKTGVAEDFNSKYRVINILEQIGRYEVHGASHRVSLIFAAQTRLRRVKKQEMINMSRRF